MESRAKILWHAAHPILTDLIVSFSFLQNAKSASSGELNSQKFDKSALYGINCFGKFLIYFHQNSVRITKLARRFFERETVSRSGFDLRLSDFRDDVSVSARQRNDARGIRMVRQKPRQIQMRDGQRLLLDQ